MTGGKLRDQRILFLGAGSAGIGIADLMASAMTMEGLTEAQARARFWLFDIHGLVESSGTDLFDFQKPYARSPRALAGLRCRMKASGRPPSSASAPCEDFTQPVVETMARINPRPIVFAYSNPT